MLTTTLSRIPPRARILQASNASNPSATAARTLLASPTTSLSLSSHRRHTQTRGYRFGRLSSYIDSALHRQTATRNRRLPRHRSMDMITRKLSWDQSPSADDPKAAIKRIMASYFNSDFNPGSGRPSSRYIDVDQVKSWSDELAGVRPGRNIEDVERNAVNDLFHGHGQSQATAIAPEHDSWRSPIENIREYLGGQRGAASAGDFVAIDPITNRKTQSQSTATATTKSKPVDLAKSLRDSTEAHLESTPSADELVSDLSASRTHFAVPKSAGDVSLQPESCQYTGRTDFAIPGSIADVTRQPVYSDGPPSAEELQKYSEIEIDPEPWVTPDQKAAPYDDLAQYGPVMDAELDAKAFGSSSVAPDAQRRSDFSEPPKAEASTPQYHDLGAHGPIRWREPDGQPEMMAEQRSKQYADLGKYRPTQWREPDGLPELTPEEKSKLYKDLHLYGPVRFNEPDGKLPLSAEELSKKYADLDHYRPVAWNESNSGQLPPSAEVLSKKYDDLHKYQSVAFNEPDGKLPPTTEELSKNYQDLHLYGPVQFNEPHGQLPPSSEELSKQYDDLHTYQPVAFNEPEGKVSSAHETTVKDYDALFRLLQPVKSPETEAKVSSTSLEGSVQFNDLGKYKAVRFNEPDGQLPPTSEEQSKQYDDLDTYQPVKWNEPDGQLPPSAEERSKRYEDLHKYEKPVRWNEPDGKLPSTAEERPKQYEDVHMYKKPVHWNEPDGLPAMTAEEASKQYTDLGEYKPVSWNEPDGKAPLHPEEASKKYKDLHAYTGPFTQESDPAQLQFLEDDLSRFERDWDSSNKAARTTVKQAKLKATTDKAEPAKKLTGSYTRDFPEDSTVSWTTLLGHQSASRKPLSQDKPESEISSFDESFPKLQPALNQRVASSDKARSQLDPYSTEPQGLELNYSEECSGKATSPSFVRTYGTVSDAAAMNKAAREDEAAAVREAQTLTKNAMSASPAKESPASSPSQYKIVAYDPTAQAISMADATSIAADTSDVLSPPAVLTRLANPTKFLPHLGPLQAQGYEIVSGSGDVLVFRKVRDTPQPASEQPPRVNPIDMMSSQPVTPQPYAATPTAYVSYAKDYNNGGADDSKPLPPFRTTTGRPRDSATDKTEPKKEKPARLRKALVGAGTVGGLSYAFGVVGDFFKSGGVEGKGPTTRF